MAGRSAEKEEEKRAQHLTVLTPEIRSGPWKKIPRPRDLFRRRFQRLQSALGIHVVGRIFVFGGDGLAKRLHRTSRLARDFLEHSLVKPGLAG